MEEITCDTSSALPQQALKISENFCNICTAALNRVHKGRINSWEMEDHHASLQSLQESAQLGCLICDQFFRIVADRADLTKDCELAPFTKYLWFAKRSTITVRFNIELLANCTPKWFKEGSFEISLRAVPVTMEELHEEMDLRRKVVTEETSWDHRGVKRLLGENTGSDQSWTLIQYWVTGCNQHHQTCKGVTDGLWFPTRLIHVGKENEDPYLHLPDSTSWNSDHYYTTLSHRWGPDSGQVTKLLSANFSELRKKINIQELPETFRDAINITRRLGAPFLWIDSLCIIQDDKEDWTREAANMSMIYANTYLNISATSAEDCHQGCYRSRDPLKVAWFPVPRERSDSDEPAWLKIVDPEIWTKNVDNAPLNQRGWVLQERLLSPRVLHFSADQVFWECRENYACESFPKTIPTIFRHGWVSEDVYIRDLVPGKLSSWYRDKEEAMKDKLWSRVIEAYSKTNLTYPTDKLIALSGIAREAQQLFKSPYAAGLWKCHLPYSLLWTADQNAYLPKPYIAPSWSWASINGEIDLPIDELLRLDPTYETYATILDIGIDLATPTNPFGQVESGWIRIRSKFALASWERTELHFTRILLTSTSHTPFSQAHIETGTGNLENFHFEINERYSFVGLDDRSNTTCQSAFFLPICSFGSDDPQIQGLLLQLLPTGQFVRIGMLGFLDKRTKEILESLGEREVVII